MPASASARISSRVNQRASSISEPSTSIVVCDGPPREADHQAGRQRPGLAAEVGHLADPHARLLLDLATHGVLHRLAGLHEARERGVAPLRPQRAASEQGPLVGAAGLAVGDDHDHCRVGPRELVATAAVAVQHVPGLAWLEWPPAPRAEAGRPEPLGEPDRVQHHRPVGDRLVGQRLHHRAQHDPLVTVAGCLLRVDDDREVLDAVTLAQQHPQPVGCLRGRDPDEPPVDRTHPRPRDDQHPRRRVGPPLLEPALVGAQQPVAVVGVLRQRDVRQQPGRLGHRESLAPGRLSSQAVNARLS